MIVVDEHSKVKREFILMWLSRVILSVNCNKFHLYCYKRKIRKEQGKGIENSVIGKTLWLNRLKLLGLLGGLKPFILWLNIEPKNGQNMLLHFCFLTSNQEYQSFLLLILCFLFLHVLPDFWKAILIYITYHVLHYVTHSTHAYITSPIQKYLNIDGIW